MSDVFAYGVDFAGQTGAALFVATIPMLLVKYFAFRAQDAAS